MAGELGVRADLELVPTEGEISTTEILYSESGGRFVLSAAPADQAELEDLFADLPLACVGRIRSASKRRALLVTHGERTILDEDVPTLKKAWKETLHGI
jgi:phosphoribosylformylglycinamidine synthase